MEIIFKNKTVIVTGGAGFIGSHLVKELIKLGAKVIVVDIHFNPLSLFVLERLDEKTKLEKIDISKKNTVLNLFKKYQPQYVFHLAAETLVSKSYQNPWKTLNTNIMGTVNVLESVRKSNGVKAVVVASSDKAYGKLKKRKYTENDALRGDHPYEVSKSATDLIAYAYFKTYNIPVVTTRFGNIYGEGDFNFSRIIPDALRAIIKNKTLQIRSNGKYVRDYIYVKDVARGYLLLASKINETEGKAFNFGSSDTLSVFELIKIIEKSLGEKIKYRVMNSAVNEIAYQSLDYSRIKKLGWQPKFKVKTSISMVYDYYKSVL